MRLKNIEKVVLDSNVVVSSAISIDGNPAKVFELLLFERIINYTTKEILDEIEGVFKREKIKKLISLEKSKFIIDSFKLKSFIIETKTKLNIINEDSEDNRILECAIDSNAGFIITGDEHLLKIKNYKNIKIVSASEFLKIFFEN